MRVSFSQYELIRVVNYINARRLRGPFIFLNYDISTHDDTIFLKKDNYTLASINGTGIYSPAKGSKDNEYLVMDAHRIFYMLLQNSHQTRFS